MCQLIRVVPIIRPVIRNTCRLLECSINSFGRGACNYTNSCSEVTNFTLVTSDIVVDLAHPVLLLPIMDRSVMQLINNAYVTVSERNRVVYMPNFSLSKQLSLHQYKFWNSQIYIAQIEMDIDIV